MNVCRCVCVRACVRVCVVILRPSEYLRAYSVDGRMIDEW